MKAGRSGDWVKGAARLLTAVFCIGPKVAFVNPRFKHQPYPDNTFVFCILLSLFVLRFESNTKRWNFYKVKRLGFSHGCVTFASKRPKTARPRWVRCNDVGKSVSAKPLIFGTKLGPRPLPQLGIMRLRSDIRMTIYTVVCVRLYIYTGS